MAKLLITFSDPQEKWMREEAERLGLPGGVSELVRRAVDAYRGETDMLAGQTIPDEVLEKITTQYPHLKLMVDNMKANPERARFFERQIATNYLRGVTKLTPSETLYLGACANGRGYGS